jgi:hypothetical protein
MRILGREGEAMTDEERRIREKIILKKMKEVSLNQDWKNLTPEYPRPNRPGSLEGEDRLKTLENRRYKEMDKDERLLEKKEDSLLDVGADPCLQGSMISPSSMTKGLKRRSIDFLVRKKKGRGKPSKRTSSFEIRASCFQEDHRETFTSFSEDQGGGGNRANLLGLAQWHRRSCNPLGQGGCGIGADCRSVFETMEVCSFTGRSISGGAVGNYTHPVSWTSRC